jgi:hypothetical protein
MHNLQNCKFQAVTFPAAAVNGAAVATAFVDTKGYRSSAFIVQLGATDAAISVLKLTESDLSGSGYTDVPGADFSVAPLTLPSATDDTKLFAIFVNHVGRKRYLDLSVTVASQTTGAFVAILAILDRAEDTPNSASERGLAQFAIV